MRLEFADRAREAIRTRCAAHPDVETGGLLLGGLLSGEKGWIGAATGPGPGAELHPKRLSWDPSYVLGVLDALDLHPISVLAPIGRWHKHCGPVLVASAEDRAGAEAFRVALGHEGIIDLIVATGDAGEPIGWAAYLCTAVAYQRVGLSPTEVACAVSSRR